MARDLGRTACSAIALAARQRWLTSLHRPPYRRFGGRGPLDLYERKSEPPVPLVVLDPA
jgi:hypothetical protein